MENFKEIACFIFFAGVPLVWIVQTAVEAWKEQNRHAEMQETLRISEINSRNTAMLVKRLFESKIKMEIVNCVERQELNN